MFFVDDVIGEEGTPFDLDTHFFLGQIPDVTFAGNNLKSVIKKVFDGLGFGGGFHDDETFHAA
jgi:hypothetical protein